jgi:hypothetical protein
MRSFMIYIPQQMLFRLANQKNEMGGTCGIYGGEEGCIQYFGGETQGKEATLKTQA